MVEVPGTFRIAASLALVLAAGPWPGHAANFPLRSAERPRFVAEVAVVPTAVGAVQLDVSWEIPYSELVFHKDEDWYRARYDVAIVFLRDDRQIDGDVWRRRVRVKTFAETRTSASRATGRKVLELPPADYLVRVTVTDRGSQAESEVEGTVNAKIRLSGVGLGDLRFLHYENGVATLNPAHEIPVGDPGHVVRVDLRPAAGVSGPVQLTWRIRNAERETVARGDSTVQVGGGPASFEIPIPTGKLSVGDHELEVRATGPTKETDRRTAPLHVRLTPRWFDTHREAALEVFDVLAGDDELQSLKEAGEGQWTQRVAKFWAARDPSPGRAGNEYLSAIMTRMETAASLFVEPFRHPGWRTDRGRVMLQYGPPARRSVQSGDFERAASELWEYESPRRVFLFVDERGSGEYWLQG